MRASLEKILAADRQGQETVAQAQAEALALKNGAEAKVKEIQARLQEDLARQDQGAQQEILAAAEAKIMAITGATERRVSQLTDAGAARRDEVASWLTARLLGR
jgi:hypothetical protein